MIPIKTQIEIGHMRIACKIAANVLHRLSQMVSPGVNTYDLDQEGKRLIEGYGATSACYNYKHGNLRFPSHTCLSVNEEVIHGIGSIKRVLHSGDIISLDVSVVYNGYIGDNAITVPVGEISQSNQFLLDSTREALILAIDQARSGNRVGYISNAVESFIRPRGLGIIRDFVGHGVGKTMHEEPQIPNFGPRKRGDYLKPGMTLAIEPMITFGRSAIEMLPDGWTAKTRDNSMSAHFEHTVLITSGDPEVLTLPDLEFLPTR